MAKLGEWAFIVGIVLAVIFGFFRAGTWAGIVTLVLVVAGLVVGFLNVTEKETLPFLVAAIALMATSQADLKVIDSLFSAVNLTVGTWLQNIVSNIAVFVAPGAVVVAVKAIKSLAKD